MDTNQELREENEILRKRIADMEFHNHNMQAMTHEMKGLFEKAIKEKKVQSNEDLKPLVYKEPNKEPLKLPLIPNTDRRPPEKPLSRLSTGS